MYRPSREELTCYRCADRDLVIDSKAGDLICRSCGEVQQGRLINEESEFIQYIDDPDGNKSSERSSGRADSITGDRSIFVGGGSDEELASLTRSSYGALNRKERAITQVMYACKELSYALNLTKHVTDGAELLLTRTYDTQSAALDQVRRAIDLVVPSNAAASFRTGFGGSGSSLRESTACVAAAVIYLACRQAQAGRTLDEVCVAAGLTRLQDERTTLATTESCAGIIVGAAVVRASARKLVAKYQSVISQELQLGGVTGLPPVRSAQVVARIAFAALQASIEKVPASTDLIERCRWMAIKLDGLGADAPRLMPPQLLAAVSIVSVCASMCHSLNLQALAKATISCSMQQILDAYARIVPHVNTLLRQRARDAIGTELVQGKKSHKRARSSSSTVASAKAAHDSWNEAADTEDSARAPFDFVRCVLPPSLAERVDRNNVLLPLPMPVFAPSVSPSATATSGQNSSRESPKAVTDQFESNTSSGSKPYTLLQRARSADDVMSLQASSSRRASNYELRSPLFLPTKRSRN